MPSDQWQAGIIHSEEFVRILASRYGFRARDLSLMWDGGKFDARKETHDLRIQTADGRSFRSQIQGTAIAQQNAWSYLRGKRHA
jgi:hypothetical protein